MKSPDSTSELNIAKIVFETTGQWGRWQFLYALAFGLISILGAWHSLMVTFNAPDVEFWCADAEAVDSSWLPHPNTTLDQCKRYPGTTANSTCTTWHYNVGRNSSFYRSTIISEWNLVCSRSWLASFSQSAYVLGAVASAIFMTHLSDRHGRRLNILIGWTISTLATLSAALAPSIMWYLLSRMAIAFGYNTFSSTGMVLLLEIVGPKYREVAGIGINFGWLLGYVSFPAVVYGLRSFRHLLLLCTVLEASMAVLYGVIYESPRWLLINGRYEEAEVVLKKAVRMNAAGVDPNNNVDTKLERLQVAIQKLKLMENSQQQNLIKEQPEANYNFFHLFKSRSLTQNTLLIWFIWFVNSLVYFGLSLNATHFVGDPFINFTLMGISELPAYAVCLYLVPRYGHRSIVLATMFGAALGTWLSIAIHSNWYLGIAGVMFGKFSITAAFCLLYIYTTELFPTVIRTIGLGSSSIVGNVGAIIAPFLNQLTVGTSFAWTMMAAGALSVAGGLAILPLQELKGTDLPDRLRDVEAKRRVSTV